MTQEGGDDIKTLTLRLDDEMHRLFKIHAINEGKSMHEMLIEQIEKMLEDEKADK